MKSLDEIIDGNQKALSPRERRLSRWTDAEYRDWLRTQMLDIRLDPTNAARLLRKRGDDTAADALARRMGL